LSTEILSAALAAIRHRISIVPIDHTTKRPATRLLPGGQWKPFQTGIADEATVRGWVAAGIKSFALVGGGISGGLLVLDFDVPRFYDAWRVAVGDLADGLPVQRTGGGGYQVSLRCPTPGGNDKLAWMPDDPETTGRSIAIETRGEGGYAVVPPSLHPAGRQYRWVSGDLTCIPVVPQARADALMAAARKLDEAPFTRQEFEKRETQARDAHRRQQAGRNGQASVIEKFNEAHPIETLLERHGYAKGAGGRYVRPGGKSLSVSVKDGRSCHWASNDPLNDGTGKSGCGCHDAFDVFTSYEHRGDGKAAVKAAADLLGMAQLRKSDAWRGDVSAVNASAMEPYRAFPMDVLPEVVARYINEGAKALGCDAAYIALPLLAALASAIGNTRRIRLKASWAEVAVLWCVIVGDSGTLKSPAFDLALRVLRKLQARAMKTFKQSQAEYRDAKEQVDAELKAWRKADAATRGDRPEEPEPPVCERLICSDTTVEALAMLLSNAWRGLLLGRDELAGWLSSFNQYKAGQGGDVAHWLELHRAGALLVDRKTGDKTTIHVPRAAVCIAGGIQPDALRRCLTPEFYSNGLAARLLLAMPPKRVKQWTEADIAHNTLEAMDKLFHELLSFQPSKDIDGDPEPVDVALTEGAKAAWVKFYDAHAKEQAELGGDLSAAWSKLEGYAARLALVVHCIRQAAGEDVDAWRCDAESMASGIALAEWFGVEAKRVYGALAETEEGRARRLLVEVIQAKGGRVTVRELSRSSRLYPRASDWETALDELAEAGIGRWENTPAGPEGGRPGRAFRLLAEPIDGMPVDTLTVDKTYDFPGNHGVLSTVGTVNGRPDDSFVGGGELAATGRETGEL
jgi:hypothetical protein